MKETQQLRNDEAIVTNDDGGKAKSGGDDSVAFVIQCSDGGSVSCGSGIPQFKIKARDPEHVNTLFKDDPYSLALAFVRGEFSIEGDLVAAIRHYRSQSHRGIGYLFYSALAHFSVGRIEAWFQSRHRAASNIRFHYDQSNEFYAQFLDSRMVYSCGYFQRPHQSLDEAQLRKIEHICRKLNIQRGESFLDIGCGWGALALHAAEKYGATSIGCTLSKQQFTFASQMIAQRQLDDRIRILLRDYREVEGTVDKMASVGMFEHVGCHRMVQYFKKLNDLLRPGGLLMNHGIMRPETCKDGPETLFLRKKIWPGAELPSLSLVIGAAEKAGFEVVDVENLRPHYALTCRSWVERLQEHALPCLRLVGLPTYRTWLLTLAASAAFFEEGSLTVNQLLLYKPGQPSQRPFTRDYMYV
jgi:cyclopropane-fatty-acyl-phospholipid synthase